MRHDIANALTDGHPISWLKRVPVTRYYSSCTKANGCLVKIVAFSIKLLSPILPRRVPEQSPTEGGNGEKEPCAGSKYLQHYPQLIDLGQVK
jgi:hypothetical protein